MPNVPEENNKIKVLDKSITTDEKKIITVFDAEMKKLTSGQTTIDRVLDTFTNIAARLGGGSSALNEGAGYVLTRFTFDYQQTTALFRNSWIVQNGVVIPATDMNKLGVMINTELDPDEVEKVQKKYDSTSQKRIEGTKWGRLYGGAVGVIMIKDIMNKYVEDTEGNKVRLIEMPLEIEDIDVDSFGGVYVLDRWNGVSPDGQLETDIMSHHYGKPKFYTINLPDQTSIRIHHSWLLIYEGIELPRLERYADSYWGMSVLEPAFRELQKRDNTNNSVANLIFQASIRVFKFENFRQSVATGSKAFQEEMNRRMESLVKYQSNQSATIIDSKDDFAIHSATFAGLDAILELFMEDIAGAFHVPMDKMYGRPGKGFSGDDKSSARNYSDFILNQQEANLRHNDDKLLKIIFKSELGAIPEDFTFDYIVHYDSDTETRRSQMEQEYTQLAIAFENGGVPRSIYLKELKQRGKEFNMFTNITDEMIRQAEEDERLDPGEVDDDYDDKEDKTTKDGKFKLFKRKNK